MLMWAATVVKNQPKSWLHQEEPAAADNKVIITQALLTAGGGELVHLRHAAMLLYDVVHSPEYRTEAHCGFIRIPDSSKYEQPCAEVSSKTFSGNLACWVFLVFFVFGKFGLKDRRLT